MSKVITLKTVQETILFKELQGRNNEQMKAFVNNIPILCEEASDRAKQIPRFFSEYTLHDVTHFIRVTELMSSILGSVVKELNDIEIGLLILSAFYHDQGMLISDDEYKQLNANEHFLLFKDNWIIDHANYSEIKKQVNYPFISDMEKERLITIIAELDSAILTDYLRETHGQRSSNFINEKLSNERVLAVAGTNLSYLLAKICLSHVQSVEWISANPEFHYDENVGTYKVNTIFLSLILRLADILDFDSDRTPDVLFKSIHFTSQISITEWQKHRSVKGWEVSKDLIRYTMSFQHPVYEKTANVFIDWIDDELNDCLSLLRKFPSSVSNYKIEVAEKVDRSRLGAKDKSYIYHDLEFSLSRNEIVKLLMTDNLYKNSSLFIRELLQNSLDALRLRRAIHMKDGFEWKSGEIYFSHYIDSQGMQVVECEDNGCGMDEDIIKKFLGKVGRSYYRSPEFERQRVQLRENGVDFEPCSQFGIGFMSCFMVGDRIEILTRKDYGQGKELGKPLLVEINGLGGLIVIKEGDLKQKVGTIVKVYPRNKPIFFDPWSDNIRLILTLKGYALATEFPVKAICRIKEIKGKISIPATIDKKKSFLELFDIKKQKTFEVDLQTINKNLRGFLRQSFLTDENNLCCIENNEAKWEIGIDDKILNNRETLKATLYIKSENVYYEYSRFHGMENSHSVCLDGILVCGYPGRQEYSELEMVGLGHMTSRVFSEHSFTIDVRGSIKPELNPAREPLDDRSVFNSPFGWRQLQNLINRGSGILWEQVLNELQEEPDVFWKLIIIYDGNINFIKCDALTLSLHLPVEGKELIKLSSVKSFSINEGKIKVTDLNAQTHLIEFSSEIINWSKTHVNEFDLDYWLSNFLISISSFSHKKKDELFNLRSSFSYEEIPDDNHITKTMSGVKIIPFEDLDNDFITTAMYKNIANLNNPLVKVAHSSNATKTKNEIQEFATSLIFNICQFMQELIEKNQPFKTEMKLRSLKHTSILFLSIDWSKYSNDLKPPYKIFISEKELISLTVDNFKFWADENE